MIELGQFSGYHYRVSSPGHVNAKGQPDDFEVDCDTLMQARAVESVRAYVAARPSPVVAGPRQWKGPATSWLTDLSGKGYTVNPYRNPADQPKELI